MWRQKRVFKIAKAVDLMLTLFPFEAKFYEQYQVPVKIRWAIIWPIKFPLETPARPGPCRAWG